ncbi:MAG: 2-phospho-L-lactate transferase [Alphaproteobacteria bacterium]|jgi:LPPG:FO 2-phospho-L-lactate transferase|nr:2-phospho-L-lactate transferase [Alphaproteobacteria bacterium]
MSDERFVLALAGGVGGGKLARGFAAILPPEQLAIAVNTADDFVHLGLYISPDVDSVLYALADRNDTERGWGLAGETWNFMAAMERLGGAAWFKLGDRDLATHILRTQALAASRTLSEVTALLAVRLGIAHTVLPMSDNPVRSIVETDEGALDFQDYFVRRRCEPEFRGVRFEGADAAEPSAGFRDALARANAIVITPSNPFVSIDPILALPGIADALRRSQPPVVAVSPIVGGKAVKGPLGKIMNELGVDPSALGVARHYGQMVDGWVIDDVDSDLEPAIEALGCRVKVCNTMMRTLDDKSRLAHDVLELAFELAMEPVE